MTTKATPTANQIRGHIEQGWTFKRIARHYGVADTTIGRAARKHRIHLPERTPAPNDTPTATTEGHTLPAGPCATENPELFFPDTPYDTEQTEDAKAVCASCPVATQCLAGATARREPTGVWGGVLFIKGSPQKKARSLIVCGTNPGYDRHRRAGTPACEPCRRAHAEMYRLKARAGAA